MMTNSPRSYTVQLQMQLGSNSRFIRKKAIDFFSICYRVYVRFETYSIEKNANVRKYVTINIATHKEVRSTLH
jgi:hypothetical protein